MNISAPPLQSVRINGTHSPTSIRINGSGAFAALCVNPQSAEEWLACISGGQRTINDFRKAQKA